MQGKHRKKKIEQIGKRIKVHKSDEQKTVDDLFSKPNPTNKDIMQALKVLYEKEG